VKLGIYETEQSILDKIQHVNKKKIIFSKKIQVIHDALYIKGKHGPDKRKTGECRDRSSQSSIGKARTTHNGTSKGQHTKPNNT
jgi:hypothetical protein